MKKLLRTNLILTAIVAVIAFSSFASAENEENMYYYPHPEYCDLFYVMDEWWGYIGTLTCPSGLCFNPTYDVCDWPEDTHSTDEWWGRTHNPTWGSSD